MARCIYILNYLSIQDKGAGQGKNDVSLSGLANINNVGLVRCWKRVLKGILIKHCYFCTRPWCQHTHHHHHHPRPPPVPLPEPALSTNHSTGFGRNGWSGLSLAAGGEIGLPPPMRAGNPGAKRGINFQLIVDE